MTESRGDLGGNGQNKGGVLPVAFAFLLPALILFGCETVLRAVLVVSLSH